MEETLKLAGTYGFPIVVALYLLVRSEQRMAELTLAIQKLCVICELFERLEENDSNDKG